MANLTDNPAAFPPAVYRIDSNDPVQGWTAGGGIGIANLAAQNLADRTAFLKYQLDNLDVLFLTAAEGAALITAHTDAADPHSQYLTAAESGVIYQTLMTGHVTSADPHPQYLTAAEGAALITAHTDAADPHSQYLTAAEGAALITGNSFATGTRIPFAQNFAPSGWTQDTSDAADNRMFRCVNTAGSGAGGGSHSPIINNVVPSHTHNMTTGSNNVGHTHTISDAGHAHNYIDTYWREDSPQGNGNNYGRGTSAADDNNSDLNYTRTTDYSGSGVSILGESNGHTHYGTTDSGSSGTNWEPRYVNLIICVKN